jgi:hypothetical protein
MEPGRFSVEYADGIRVHCVDGVVSAELEGLRDPRVQRELTEGVVSGLRSHLAGQFVLHASSVAFGNSVVALMGDQGAGKSSLSFACAQEPIRMVSDGMTVVDPSSLQVQTGLPRWKLSDASITRFQLAPEDYEFVNEDCYKRYVPFQEKAEATPGALSVVLWVTVGDSERLEELEPREQLLALVQNAYLVNEFPVNEQQQLLQRAAKVLSTGVVVKRLVRRMSWEAMPAAVSLVRGVFGII